MVCGSNGRDRTPITQDVVGSDSNRPNVGGGMVEFIFSAALNTSCVIFKEPQGSGAEQLPAVVARKDYHTTAVSYCTLLLRKVRHMFTCCEASGDMRMPLPSLRVPCCTNKAGDSCGIFQRIILRRIDITIFFPLHTAIY